MESLSWMWSRPFRCCSDADGDGLSTAPCDDDCDDADPTDFPGNLEMCSDGRDNNCDDLVDCADQLRAGRSCDDGDPPTINDACDSQGACRGIPSSCDDGNLCTTDVFDPASGSCTHSAVICSLADYCQTHACLFDEHCTTLACDPATGACMPWALPDGSTCYARDICTVNICRPGVCDRSPIHCDDHNSCTDDFCINGVCRYVRARLFGTCDDGNPCTLNDYCELSDCFPGRPACDDQNPCTVDQCNPATLACSYMPTPAGTTCSDDGNACTLDVCDPATASCSHPPAPAGTACSDGNACTIGDVCRDGVCRGDTPPSCDDGNRCTADLCDPQRGCVHQADDSLSCDDGNVCTLNDRCSAGACLPGAPLSCDNGNPCTVDACDPEAGCQNAPTAGAPCDDGNSCTASDTCDAQGGCVGQPIPYCTPPR